jgi:hypothetical protein
MVVLMDVSQEAIVALNWFTSFWVSTKLDCKVLKRDSSSWLQVWVMRMGELKMGGQGKFIFFFFFKPKNDMDEYDKGEEMNPME